MPRLVFVCTPAGFGNTTLIAQWLAPGERGEGEGELVITTRADPAAAHASRAFLRDHPSLPEGHPCSAGKPHRGP